MKLNKEIKYNLYLIIGIYLIRDLGNFILNYKNSSNSLLDHYWLNITFLITSICIYGYNYLILLPRFYEKKRYFKFAIGLIFAIPLFSGIRYLLEEIILFQFTKTHNYFGPDILTTHLLDSFYYALVILLISTAIYFLFRYHENQAHLHLLKTQHQNAQMAVLKSQISPHFLFNTLNSFYVDLFDTQPDTAADILKLSNLLRFVIYETDTDYIALSKDLDFINNYLYFFKRRYEDNFFVKLTINGAIDSKKIPSMILIHFIENVCKHGIINRKDKPANINICINEDTLEIRTKNHINSSEKHHEQGIGTENILQRLTVLFKNNYQFQKKQAGTIFEVSLKFPIT